MFCVLISLSCGISLKVLNALLKMLLFKNTSFSLQVCAYAMMSWHYSMYATVSISHLYICVYVMHLSEQKRLRTLKSNQRQDAVLSERKNEFNFRQSYLWKEVSDLSFSLLVFSFSFLLSLLLTVFDCIRQVNEKQQWRNDWQPFLQPAPARVYVCVRIPASAYVKLSLGLRRASHHDDEMVREWWEPCSYPQGEALQTWNGYQYKLLFPHQKSWESWREIFLKR